MTYNEKTYLLRMSQREYELIKKVASNMRRSMKDAILYSIEQQESYSSASTQEKDHDHPTHTGCN